MVTKWATRLANATIATSTPRTTPIARLLVHTVATTVVSITVVSDFGIRAKVLGRIECQSKVAQDTKIIIATSAAIGISATMSPRATTRSSRRSEEHTSELQS